MTNLFFTSFPSFSMFRTWNDLSDDEFIAEDENVEDWQQKVIGQQIMRKAEPRRLVERLYK
jgi:hypothetical protein